MKYALILLLTGALCSFVIPLKKKSGKLPKALRNCKAVVHVPADNDEKDLYIFRNEVSNLDYQEFLFFLRNNNRLEELRVAEMDSLNWLLSEFDQPQQWVTDYHLKPELPVVNVSKKGAEVYCRWLSEIWNQNQSQYTVRFRLPTIEEWKYAANAGHNKSIYPWGGPEITNSKGCYLARVKNSGESLGPVATGTYSPNDFGLYNTSGNVSEWVSDSDQVFGGHWNSTGEEATIHSSFDPGKSSYYVGFRPVMTFKLRSNS
ncbi:MAG: formylglycine-generating enzyme family protein [Flavobacteriales bacterium]